MKILAKIGACLAYKYLLPSDCPDCLKIDGNGEIICYRITKSQTIRDDDFTPTGLLNEKRYSQAKSNEARCKLMSISLFTHKKEAETLISHSSRVGTYVATGKIVAEVHGALKRTPSDSNPSHCDWFPLETINEKDFFE